MPKENNISSAGHKLGQTVGDWYEQYFVFPMLAKIANKLQLRLASRFIPNSVTVWKDIDGNEVDYDFVMSLCDQRQNIMPVAFFESFWRRGTRHSKDKARDDCGKLMPMKNTYSTTRLLSIVAAGDFTAPAREYVHSRNIDLFYIAKPFIIEAWRINGFVIDYADNLPEQLKADLVNKLENAISTRPSWGQVVAETLQGLDGISTQISSFLALIYSKLSAIPVEYRIVIAQKSDSVNFSTYQQVDAFLNSQSNHNPLSFPHTVYSYEVDFGNGDFFIRDNLTFNEMMIEHNNLKKLICHMEVLV